MMSAINTTKLAPTTETLGYNFLMPFTTPAIIPSVDSMQAALADNAKLRAQVNALQRRIEWFERQIFGQKSERRIVDTDAQVQLGLEEPAANSADKAPAPKRTPSPPIPGACRCKRAPVRTKRGCSSMPRACRCKPSICLPRKRQA